MGSESHAASISVQTRYMNCLGAMRKNCLGELATWLLWTSKKNLQTTTIIGLMMLGCYVMKILERSVLGKKCQIDAWYQEYYNELDPDLDRLNKTGKILEERKIRNPPYAKAFETTITIGNYWGTTKKCVGYDHMSCYKNAGDRGIRVNADHKNANDAFIIETTANKVCAQRVDGAY